ncbi:DUF4440 domain-containing protein [Promicromonospora sp. NPDC052451]|uniref:DUF4440 domain-containing protein n=1 Tax=Promicromonospora sp. NPDC052451 TaxID=3364407 RepID=UPI0037C916C2
MPDRTIQFFLDLESQVWDALARGDGDADRELLSEDFVGVYPSGFATRAEHVGELADGPTVTSYALSEARLIDVAPDSVLLCYRADYQPSTGPEKEAMYISSLWVERDGRWWNTFSQDSMASA